MEHTVENIQVEGVDVEARLEVPLEDVAGGVDVGSGVGRELHLGEIGDGGAVLHGLGQPEEAA